MSCRPGALETGRPAYPTRRSRRLGSLHLANVLHQAVQAFATTRRFCHAAFQQRAGPRPVLAFNWFSFLKTSALPRPDAASGVIDCASVSSSDAMTLSPFIAFRDFTDNHIAFSRKPKATNAVQCGILSALQIVPVSMPRARNHGPPAPAHNVSRGGPAPGASGILSQWTDNRSDAENLPLLKRRHSLVCNQALLFHHVELLNFGRLVVQAARLCPRPPSAAPNACCCARASCCAQAGPVASASRSSVAAVPLVARLLAAAAPFFSAYCSRPRRSSRRPCLQHSRRSVRGVPVTLIDTAGLRETTEAAVIREEGRAASVG